MSKHCPENIFLLSKRTRSRSLLQNHCLRVCLGIRDPRDITRVDLHNECGCDFLIERRRVNLLRLMYQHSRDPDNVLHPVRVLRNFDKIKFKLQRPKGAKYRASPLYRGYGEWSKIEADVQRSDTKENFMSQIRK